MTEAVAIFRRHKSKALRAQRAAEQRAFEESFSYEDDLRKAAASAPASASQSAPQRQDQQRPKR